MFDKKNMVKALGDTLAALGEESLQHLVLIGGWLPFVYSHFLWEMEAPGLPSTTDIDLGVMETGPKGFPETLFEKLKKAGLALESVYEEEQYPIQFVHKSKGINVNAIAPSFFETELTAALREDPDRSKSITARTPAGRWGTPEDIAGAAVFLASPASDFVHGVILPVDGGWMAW